jgi:importin subunit beta-1
VAAIASIEIPNKEWADLLPMLCNNAQHDDFNVKLSSLTTLGYICEELQLIDGFNPNDLDQSTKNAIIIALVNNINKGDSEATSEPCRIAIRALVPSIPYASANFLVQHEKDFIMERVFLAC